MRRGRRYDACTKSSCRGRPHAERKRSEADRHGSLRFRQRRQTRRALEAATAQVAMKRGYRGVRVHGDEPRAREVPRAGSHRRRYSIPTDPPRATLQRFTRLLDRSDEYFRARLEIVIVALHVSNNWRVGTKIFFYPSLYFSVSVCPSTAGPCWCGAHDPHPITAEAYEAIAATLPFGSVTFERD